jgi:valyl-tRNA synthetase
MWETKLEEPAIKNESGSEGSKEAQTHFAVQWFDSRLEQAKNDIQKLIAEFKLSEALKNLYSLIWDDFCSWYLEWVKPGFGQPLPASVYSKTISFFDELLLWLHPFMPFVTEEIYHLLKERAPGDDLCIKQYGAAVPADPGILEKGDRLRLLLTVSREFRQQQQMKHSEPISRIFLPKEIFGEEESLYDIIRRQLNATALDFNPISGHDHAGLQMIPLLGYQIGLQAELKADRENRKPALEKELAHYRGFLESLTKKLGNERFLQNARPEVITLEKKKKSDTEEKIAAIEETLKGLL